MNRLAITDYDPQGSPDDPRSPNYDERKSTWCDQREAEIYIELYRNPTMVLEAVGESIDHTSALWLINTNTPLGLKARAYLKKMAAEKVESELSKL